MQYSYENENDGRGPISTTGIAPKLTKNHPEAKFYQVNSFIVKKIK